MTTRSLGLRRHSPPPPVAAAPAKPIVYADQAPMYGLGRGLPRRRIIPSPADRSIVEEPTPEAVLEHIQSIVESEVVIEGVETAAPVVEKPTFVCEHPGFLEWTDGELVPCAGHYTAKDGAKFIDGVPAFLMRDRAPVSNIR